MSEVLARLSARMAPASNVIQMAKGSETHAEIYIYDQIGDDGFMGGISPKAFVQELNNLPQTVKNITVRINSPGGSVFDGMTMFNLLKMHKAKIHVIVDGMAASIASIIMLAGDEITMGDGAMVMIHKPWTWAMGNNDELDARSTLLLQLEQQMLNVYVQKWNLSREQIASMLRSDTWIDAKTAKSYGFVHNISEEKAVIAASMLQANWIKNAPKNIETVTAAAKADISDTRAKIQELLKGTQSSH